MRGRIAGGRLRESHQVLLRGCGGEALDYQRRIRQPSEFLSVLRLRGEGKGRENRFMKWLPVTWGRWVELFLGVLWPSSCMMPLLILIPLPYWEAALGGIFGVHSPTVGQKVISGFAFLLISGWFVFVIGLAVTLWRLILYGPNQINQSLHMRRFSVLALIFLLGLAIYIFYEYFIRLNPFERPGLLLTLCEIVVIWGVIIVGLRHLPSLLRGTKA